VKALPVVKALQVMLIATLLSHGAVADVQVKRLVTLSRGVNLINVFSEEKSLANLRDEVAAVHRSGFRHIRFFIDPAWVLRPKDPQRLDQVINAAFAAELGVIICMHFHTEQFSGDPQQIDQWTKAWLTLARHYSNTNPDALFFELLNEPRLANVSRWADIQETLRRKLRAVAPHHTLLLTSSPVSTSIALAQLPPSSDDNVAYVFHVYSPMVFTHQGADWADPAADTIRGLKYPPEDPNVAIVERAAAPKYRASIREFGNRGRGVIDQDIEHAVEWARRNHAHLVATEFGVYRRFAPLESRIAWLHDTRVAFEKAAIGWSVWEYNGGFGIKPELDLGCGPLPIALGLCS
jgi:endoglucanase